MKPKVLYHGSPVYVSGIINPNRAVDPKNPHTENNLYAVYASDSREIAISRAIEKGNFSEEILRRMKEPRHVFLYTLPPESFEQSTINPSQYLSFIPVMPLKVEQIDLFEHLGLAVPNFWQHIITPPLSLTDKLLWGFAASSF